MIRMKNSLEFLAHICLNRRAHLFFSTTCWVFYVTMLVRLLSRSKPTLYRYTTPKSNNLLISSKLSLLPDRLCYIWTSKRDAVLRSLPFNYRYGLPFEIKNNNRHLLLIILLSGDMAANPGPTNEKNLRCLSFDAQSIRRGFKPPDGTLANILQSFNDLVYAENLGITLMTETWLNDSISNNEILPKGYP